MGTTEHKYTVFKYKSISPSLLVSEQTSKRASSEMKRSLHHASHGRPLYPVIANQMQWNVHSYVFEEDSLHVKTVKKKKGMVCGVEALVKGNYTLCKYA